MGVQTIPAIPVKFRCAVCQEPFVQIRKAGRQRVYCSIKCKEKNPARIERKRKTRVKTQDRKNSIPDKNKIQCLICKRWYIQVCLHAYKRHGIKEKEYKKMNNLFLRKSQLPEWYKKLKQKLFWKNPTLENLIKKKYEHKIE